MSVVQGLIGTITETMSTGGGGGSSVSPFDTGPGYSPIAGSLFINGSGTFTCSNDGDFAVGTGDYCIEWWMWMDRNSASNSRVWQLGNWPSAPFGISIEGNSTSRNVYFWCTGTSTYVNLGSFTDAELHNQWVHLALTRQGGTTTLWRNGSVWSGSVASYDITDTTTPMTIGMEYSGSSVMTGHIADFHVIKGVPKYTSSFTPPTLPIIAQAESKMLLHFTSSGSLTTDSSGNVTSKTITASGPSWNVRGPYLAPKHWWDFNNSASYDGTSTVINIGRKLGNLILMSNYSYTASPEKYMHFATGYAQIDQTVAEMQDFTTGITFVGICNFGSSVGSFERIFDFGNGAPSDNIIFCRNSNTNLALWSTANGSSAQNSTLDSSFTSAGLKMMAVSSSTSGNANAYVNGSVVNTLTGVNLPTNVARNNLYVGRSNWGPGVDADFEGDIACLLFYNRALSDAEITVLYNALKVNYTTSLP